MKEKIDNPKYATGVGLLKVGLLEQAMIDTKTEENHKKGFKSILNKIKEFFGEII